MLRVVSTCLFLIAVHSLAATGSAVSSEEPASEVSYPPADRLQSSPGDTPYYVDPAQGDDANPGTESAKPWRTLRMVNRLRLASGDRVHINPGTFTETLKPSGEGTAAKPIEILFARGEFDFRPENALKRPLHISNNNDDPYTPKAIALCFEGVRHLRIVGDKADVYIHGKMIQTLFDHAEDVELVGLAVDYRRPTVSEFTILDAAADHADVLVHPDSTYAIENGRLVWVGEGWRSTGMGSTQQCDPVEGRVRRRDNWLGAVTRVEELAPRTLRLFYDRNPGLAKGLVLQFREIHRDGCGGLVNRSRNIVWRDCAYHFLHGLGIVSQFSENLTFDRVVFAPRTGSGRTCTGWADLLHFSGCRGSIRVLDCLMSGTNDDPINVHGTHLRVVGRPADDQILVRFMHPQTYGLEAFSPGDEIEFVDHNSLRSYAANGVKTVEPKSDKEILLTLEKPAPASVAKDDVIENVTWTPEVVVRGCTVAFDSCRGFLLTTRRPILIENNTFLKTSMPAILIADDANSWFESGPVRDVVIRGNRFVRCAEPVIHIAPENHSVRPDEPVHENIRILDNVFDVTGDTAVSAKSVQGLTIASNRFSSQSLPVRQNACTAVVIENNTLDAK